MTTENRLEVELICVGDELLDGRTQDLNGHWLGAELWRRGHRLVRTRFVSDRPGDLISALDSVACPNVMVSGGLGPTEDDRVRDTVAKWLAVPLALDSASLRYLKLRLAERNYPFTSSNARQAYFPETATVLATEIGTAPGFSVENETFRAWFTPGVPTEFQWFAQSYLFEALAEQDSRVGTEHWEHTWKFFGLGESQVADRLDGLDRCGAELHYLARFPEVHVFAHLETADAAACGQRLERGVAARIGDYLVADDNETLIGRLASRLRSGGLTVATAESCTGGQIGQVLTSIGGSSHYYREGFVTYTNQSKVTRLGVDERLLNAHGAVSAEVAIAMARGARTRTDVSWGLACTGVAGPSGGTTDKPVGTVHIALAGPKVTLHRRLNIRTQPRDRVRTITVWAVLSTLLWELEGRLPADLVDRI